MEIDGVETYIKDDENNTSAEEEENVLIEEEFSISYDQQDLVMLTSYEKTAANSQNKEESQVTFNEPDLVMQTSYEKVAAKIVASKSKSVQKINIIRSNRVSPCGVNSEKKKKSKTRVLIF